VGHVLAYVDGTSRIGGYGRGATLPWLVLSFGEEVGVGCRGRVYTGKSEECGLAVVNCESGSSSDSWTKDSNETITSPT
jgi:hypothetical protein